MATYISLLKSMRSKAGKVTLPVLAALMTAALPSCGGADEAVTPISVHRLDHALLSGNLSDSTLLRPAEVLFRLSGYGELNDSTLAVYAANPSINMLAHATDSVWKNTEVFSRPLGKMKANFNRIFPDVSFPGVYAIISPFNQSVFTADSLLYVGLNHYLGADYPPYAYFPDYIRVRKTPERLMPDIAETILRRDYPYAPQEEYPTVLSRLLYEGALIEAEMQLAGVSEQQALGYDDSQMEWLMKNERQLWETIVGRKYLFSTDSQLAASLVNLAPFTSVFGQEVPGAAGRFIGHRIVNAYLDNRAIPIPQLLTPDFYESETALQDARY